MTTVKRARLFRYARLFRPGHRRSIAGKPAYEAVRDQMEIPLDDLIGPTANAVYLQVVDQALVELYGARLDRRPDRKEQAS